MNGHYKVTLSVLFLIISSFTHSIYAQTKNEKELIAGEKINKTITALENQTYTVELDNGMVIIGEVVQKGIDLVVDIYKPNGDLLKQIDSPNGTDGPEPIDITSNESGKYKLVIHTLEKDVKKGAYSLKVAQILSLTDNTKRITKRELPTEILYNLWESSLTNTNAIDAFVAKHKEKHLIEPIEGDDINMLVTYFCIPRENTEYAMLSGGPDFLGLRFQRLVNTKLFFVTQRVPKDARFNYGFNYFNLDTAGPQNGIEHRSNEQAYDDGIVVMPEAAKQPYIISNEKVAKGKVFQTTINSKLLSEERKITVYTPPNYDSKRPHHLVIIFDGESYGAQVDRRSRIPTPTILDNLITENKITPTVAILVWSMGRRKRTKDLISDNFSAFIAKELVPYARSLYNIYPQADKVVVAGSSRGGFAASNTALNHPEIIGNVLSQSGSYWIKGTENENHWIYPEYNGKLIDSYKNTKKLPIKFYMDIGLYDAGASMLGMNRQFRDILDVKGYEVDYREFKGGHNHVNWRGTLSDGLISLIGVQKE